MRRLLLLCALLALGGGALRAQTPVIALHQADTVRYLTDLADALAQAQDGDTLYLPGAVFAIPDGLTLDKRLTVVGAGVHPDTAAATSPTLLTAGDLRLTAGASGGLLTGVYVAGRLLVGTSAADHALTNYRIERAYLAAPVYLSYCETDACPSAVNGLTLRQCVLGDTLYGANARNVQLDRCLLDGGLRNFRSGGLRANHCAFLGPARAGAQPYLNNLLGGDFRNNVFVDTLVLDQPSFGCAFRNNVFTYDFKPRAGNIDQNNVKSVPLDSIFGEAFVQTFAYRFDYAADYSILADGRAAGKGEAGADPGPTGGLAPLKAGFKPFNPYVRDYELQPFVGPDGRLRITLEFEAQDE